MAYRAGFSGALGGAGDGGRVLLVRQAVQKSVTDVPSSARPFVLRVLRNLVELLSPSSQAVAVDELTSSSDAEDASSVPRRDLTLAFKDVMGKSEVPLSYTFSFESAHRYHLMCNALRHIKVGIISSEIVPRPKLYFDFTRDDSVLKIVIFESRDAPRGEGLRQCLESIKANGSALPFIDTKKLEGLLEASFDKEGR